MSAIIARCRSCGFEQAAEFTECPVCLGTSSWWCAACNKWLAEKLCAACRGDLLVPAEVHVGSFPPGIRVPFQFTVRNPGAKWLEFSIDPSDLAIAVPTHRWMLRAFDSVFIAGTIAIGAFPPGRRMYPLRFVSTVPTETVLIVEIVPAVVRLEFNPPHLAFRNLQPGNIVRREMTVKNAGNLPVSATVRASEPWLAVMPMRIELVPGASTTLRLAVKSRKSSYGMRAARIRVEADGGQSWEAVVRGTLPEPELEAARVDLGDVFAGYPAFASVTVRNTGKVRVACTLATDRPWLAVTPKRVNLPAGGEKVLKVRALIPEELAGPCEGAVVVSFDGRELLHVPVAANCQIPKPILGTVRRQSLGAIANDLPVVRGFRVTNTGDGRLDCQVSANVPWIEVLTRELAVGAGKKRRVEFKIDTPRMTRGLNIATIRVWSNGGVADVPVSVTIVDPRPELAILGNVDLGMVFAHESVGGHLAVRNVGVGLLKLLAVAEDHRVSVTPSEAMLPPGPPTKLNVLVSVAGQEAGSHVFGIRFTGNGGSTRAEVRLQLPIEKVDVPSAIDLGDRAAGRPIAESLSVRNSGPDRVGLRIRAEDSWVRPATDQIALMPGETIAVPFHIEFPQGISGPVANVIWLEGRTLRQAVAVRAVVRKIELTVIPFMLVLGGMKHGEERAITFLVVNKGEIAATIPDSHTIGELEVWLRRQTVHPGETAIVTGRVKMNARAIGKQLRAASPLTDDVFVQFSARVVRSRMPRIVAGVTAVAGLAAGAALVSTVGWFFGGVVAVAGFAIAGVILVLNEGR